MKTVIYLTAMLCMPVFTIGQSIDLLGRIDSGAGMNIENVHVINKTTTRFTITNTYGQFKIPVKLHDTLSFSSIQHKAKEVIITKDIIMLKTLLVSLEEQINELDAIVVGKVLTGDLMFDVQNTEGKAPINFYDVGIPGYTGKLATQSERRLKAANGDGVSAKVLISQILTASVQVDPIINAISGRTKELKLRVEIEGKTDLIHRIKARLANDFFISNPLEEHLKMDFFYFCEDDIDFLNRCKNKTDFEVLIFLKAKYKQYLQNRQLNKN